MKQWPFPGDGPLVRARKVALAYRNLAQEQHKRALDLLNALSEITVGQWEELVGDDAAELHKNLLEAIGNPVEDLDNRFTDWGITWHAERPVHHDPDDYVDVHEASKVLHLEKNTVYTLRIRGRLPAKYVPDSPGAKRGKYMFKVADLYKLSEELRARNLEKQEKRERGWNLNKMTDSLPDSSRGDTE